MKVRAGVQAPDDDASTDPYLRLADGVVRAVALVYAPEESPGRAAVYEPEEPRTGRRFTNLKNPRTGRRFTHPKSPRAGRPTGTGTRC